MVQLLNYKYGDINMALTADQLEAISIITNATASRDYAKAIRADDNYALAEIARLGPWYLEQAQKAAADITLWQSLIQGS